MTLGNVYTYTAFTSPEYGVTDLAGNQVDAAQGSATFIAQYYNGDLATLRNLPTNGVLPLGSLTNRGFDLRVIQVATNKIATGNFNNLVLIEQLLAGSMSDMLPVVSVTNTISTFGRLRTGTGADERQWSAARAKARIAQGRIQRRDISHS